MILRTLVPALLFATCGLALRLHAGNPPAYDIQELEPLPGLFPLNGNSQILPGANGMSWAVAANATGQTVGRRDIWPERHAMLWEGAAFTVLPDLGGDFAWATNINDEGTICGGSLDDASELYSVLWDGATHGVTLTLSPNPILRESDISWANAIPGAATLTVTM